MTRICYIIFMLWKIPSISWTAKHNSGEAIAWDRATAQDGQGKSKWSWSWLRSHHRAKAELSMIQEADRERKKEREWAAKSQLGQLWGTIRKFLCFNVSKESNWKQPHAFHFLCLLSRALSAYKANLHLQLITTLILLTERAASQF